MTDALIRLNGYSFALGGRQILSGISLAVRDGEYLSIVGPNGAGKTTLLKCLDRIHLGGSGVIEVAGKPLDSYAQRDLARLIAYVPQANGRHSPFTVFEHVMMARYPYLSPFSSFGRRDKEAVFAALDEAQIQMFADRRLSELSGGERQKVYLASALAQGVKILLLDEPTTFLDPKHVTEIQKLLWRVNRERGITVISVTHDINQAVLMSDRVVALKDGAVAFDGPSFDFMQSAVLERIYLKSFLFARHPENGKMIVVPECAE